MTRFHPLLLLLVVACARASSHEVPLEQASHPAAVRVLEPMPALAVLPQLDDPPVQVVELGRRLFFEPRLSGDASMSCATCHDPAQGFSDGKALAQGYPGSRYFRRAPGLMNTAHKRLLYWDGRMDGADLQTLVRDHISEAHFMQADGRLVLERLRQVPYYETTFREVMGGEPSYGRILKAVAAFVRSLNSQNAPFDRFLAGHADAISESARSGHGLFTGKAGCVRCHHGPMLSDESFHATGVPGNPDVFEDPLRHITFRRFFKTLGVSNFHRLDHDPGRFAITKDEADRAAFRTPTLRELGTGPYMHNGVFSTLEEVVGFYDAREALGLTAGERSDLVAFLLTLSGDPLEVEVPEPLDYHSRELGAN